jgi:hypothetical protein
MSMTDRERRVVAARGRDRDWSAEVEALRATKSLDMELAVIYEGYGDLTPYLLPDERGPSRAEQGAAAYAGFEQEQRERLSVLSEARPEAAVVIAREWESWWHARCGT